MFELGTMVSIVVQLYAVMNPLVAIPKFLEVVEFSEGGFMRTVNRVFLTIILLNFVFVLGGNYILSIFGISLSSLKIAGGIILLAVAIDTLITGHKPEKVETGDLIVVPIATPLIVGPGTMTTLILLSGLKGITMTLISSLIACFLVYLTLLISTFISRLLGPTFINGLGKFMSLIIASFAVEMLLSGFQAYYPQLLSK
ncbi:MAG: MarC family protein [Fervidicoccaceae archaeon]|nr:MAG: MarC family protein [Fervidicoccus fontis]